MTKQKRTWGDTAWDAFQYSIVPAALLGSLGSELIPLASSAGNAAMMVSAMGGGGLHHELPLAIPRGIHGVHHIEKQISRELKGKLKHLLSKYHLDKHLSGVMSGSGFQEMDARNKRQQQKRPAPAPKKGSSASSYLIPLGALLAGLGSYYGKDYIPEDWSNLLPEQQTIPVDLGSLPASFDNIDDLQNAMSGIYGVY